jgi:RNA polymerase sigma-70 factor (ECF subfamily)
VAGDPRLDPDEEAELLRAARDPHQATRTAAQARLFAALHPLVLALCLRLTGSQSAAEDAAQETFIAAFRALPAFPAQARLSTWLYRIAVREALRHRTRERRRQHEPLPDEAPGERVPDPAVSRERRELLARALDSLPAEQRVVLSLFAVDGLSHREIAEIMAVPEGTVWSRLHAAKKRLSAALGGLTSA